MKFNIDNFKIDKVGSDRLFVAVDFCDYDTNVLLVGRKNGDIIEIINQFTGDKASGVYHLLTGGAELINIKEVPTNVLCDGNDEQDLAYCPHCHECIGSNECVWEDFYYRDWKPMHCTECGQAMIWK